MVGSRWRRTWPAAATEHHEAARIDRQLFGRCGRQGDPGSYEVIASLEDELFSVHGGALSRRLARVTALSESGSGSRSDSRTWRMARALSARSAQLAAERLHSRMRRDLMDLDTRLETMLAFSGRPE